MPGRSPRILVIRRDNIGDLACTTPLLRALRSQLPDAYLAALVTQYNAAVLAGNPDLDAVIPIPRPNIAPRVKASLEFTRAA